MKIIVGAILMLALNDFAIATPIDCFVNQENHSVTIMMKVPHPDHALIYRPDGETVWLQLPSGAAHQQVDDFSNLTVWIIDSHSLGTVWMDGKAVAQNIINGSGKYTLYIAENLETEPENTFSIQCTFQIN